MADDIDGAHGGVNPADWTLVRNAAAAVLFLQGGMYMMDTTSTLLSSPWTIENVAADDDKKDSAKRLVRQATIVGAIFDGIAAAVAGSWWPVVGWGITAGYLQYEYRRAITAGEESGSSGFGFK